jgi:hypothetical protein
VELSLRVVQIPQEGRIRPQCARLATHPEVVRERREVQVGVRVVSRRAITKDKFVPEGRQDLEFFLEMSLSPEGFKFSWDGPPGDLLQGPRTQLPALLPVVKRTPRPFYHSAVHAIKLHGNGSSCDLKNSGIFLAAWFNRLACRLVFEKIFELAQDCVSS